MKPATYNGTKTKPTQHQRINKTHKKFPKKQEQLHEIRQFVF